MASAQASSASAQTSGPAATSTPNYLTGQVVAVQFGGRLCYCISGSADESAVVIKRTNSQSGGFQEIRFGTKMVEGELDLAYNGDNPPNIAVGTFGTLIIDTVGYEISEGQENSTPGQNGGAATNSAPIGETITINAGVTKVSRSWNADSGDYGWKVSFTSSGEYQVVQATGASPTT